MPAEEVGQVLGGAGVKGFVREEEEEFVGDAELDRDLTFFLLFFCQLWIKIRIFMSAHLRNKKQQYYFKLSYRLSYTRALDVTSTFTLNNLSTYKSKY